jgi:hypothetical protein
LLRDHRLSAKDGYNRGRLFDADEATAIFCDGNARVLDLTRSSLAAELLNELIYLTETSGTDRMPLRLETARGIDRDAAAECGFASFGEPSALTGLAESGIFNWDDFSKGGCVVHFRDRDIPRTDTLCVPKT